MGWLMALLILALLVGVPVLVYNKLVAAKNQYQNAFAQIEVQLKRRHDLIPNLVEAAKAYLSHENQTLVAVTQARNAAVAALQAAHAAPQNPAALAALVGSENQLLQALKGLNVQLEAYPELQANENIKQLSEEIASTENRVSFARQAYNDAVMGYNTTRQSFPYVVLAGFFGHKQDAALLQFADSETIQNSPKVSF
ncbi:LemA family protein [Paralysiella testudinis]|uniref:LemA family protein n=1 Tax=Paralysiella testudinis TaxID=2809020 RepID=A0A892ZEC6_9NEIS|nr:LemA family protein [Paralysiella testudinis]QRQ81391.1 LemA family protein [Paralysiella testudinis]